jgi:nitroimidazol reductase NimA-like FMN-containing flavoprotein (pyridoxamine 5'-phosphate oxidase superfamily)
MTTYSPTPRTALHRRPARASYDKQTVHAILDEALVCQLGFVVDGQPFVIPTTFVRDGEALFVHGSVASRMLRTLSEGVPACLNVTLLDGLVLARSAFHHSMNYRSVVVLGVAREVADLAVKRRALELLVEKLSPGRSSQARAPTEAELKATSVLAMAIEEVSAKARAGGPIDDPEDMGVPVWAGVVPVGLRAGTFVPDGPATEAYVRPTVPLPPG